MKPLFAKAIANRRANPVPTGAEPPQALTGAVRVAPLGGWYVHGPTAPHARAATIVLPHLDTVEQLTLAVQMWRHQSVKPYLCVIDTGSPWPVVEQLEKLRDHDCEIHYVRGHGYKHSSEPVTAALDLAHTRCQTEYLFHTHADVFPLRRDFLAMMLSRCTPATPVVGWQMSPRTSIQGSHTRHEWKECVSHTATMIHMPTAHRARLTWAMEGYFAARPQERGPTVGWPDTESPFLLGMRAAGISPLLLGSEPNFKLHDIVADGIAYATHARSFTGLKAVGSGEKWEAAKSYMAETERQARARLAAWGAPHPCTKRSAEPTGETECKTCGGRVSLKVFSCAEHGTCTIAKPAAGVGGCCGSCKERTPPA